MDRPLKKDRQFGEKEIRRHWQYASIIVVGWIALVTAALIWR